MAVSDWSTDPAANTSVGPVNIAEGCPAANMNNMGREIMAQIKAFSDGLAAIFQAKDDLLTALAGQTVAADRLIYATGPDAFSVTALTAFGRSLIDDADAIAACQTLGAVRVASLALSSPGHIRFQVGANQYFQVAWGRFTAAANAGGNTSYQTAFPNAAFVVCSGTAQVSGAERNTTAVIPSGSANNGFSYFNAESYAVDTFYIAVGY